MSGRREIVSRGSSGDPVAVRRIVIAADRERLAYPYVYIFYVTCRVSSVPYMTFGYCRVAI